MNISYIRRVSAPILFDDIERVHHVLFGLAHLFNLASHRCSVGFQEMVCGDGFIRPTHLDGDRFFTLFSIIRMVVLSSCVSVAVGQYHSLIEQPLEGLFGVNQAAIVEYFVPNGHIGGEEQRVRHRRYRDRLVPSSFQLPLKKALPYWLDPCSEGSTSNCPPIAAWCWSRAWRIDH